MLTVQVKRRLYRSMLLTRKVEEKIVQEYSKKEMRCPTHLYIGQEAIAAGVCAALRTDDLLYAYYRSHGWYLSKGGDLKAMISELMGRDNGCSRGWGGSMHLIDLKAGILGMSAIVGGTISHAAGAALALKIRKEKRVVVTSFGDAAIEEGTFHETMNMASLHKLPLVLICENNLYAVNTHIRDRQAQITIHKHASRFHVPGFEVDGNDAVAVYKRADEAIRRARAGKGPTLIVCRTYRLLEHCGMSEDHHLGYRTKKEIDRWRKNGPLVKGKGLISAREAAILSREIDASIDEAFAQARRSAFPTSFVANGRGKRAQP